MSDDYREQAEREARAAIQEALDDPDADIDRDVDPVQIIGWLEQLQAIVNKDWHSRPRHKCDGDSPTSCGLQDAEWLLRSLFEVWDQKHSAEAAPEGTSNRAP